MVIVPSQSYLDFDFLSNAATLFAVEDGPSGATLAMKMFFLPFFLYPMYILDAGLATEINQEVQLKQHFSHTRNE